MVRSISMSSVMSPGSRAEKGDPSTGPSQLHCTSTGYIILRIILGDGAKEPPHQGSRTCSGPLIAQGPLAAPAQGARWG